MSPLETITSSNIIGTFTSTQDPTLSLEFRDNGVLIIKGNSKYDQGSWYKGVLPVDGSDLLNAKVVPGDGVVVKAHQVGCQPTNSDEVYWNEINRILINKGDCTVMEEVSTSGDSIYLLDFTWRKNVQ